MTWLESEPDRTAKDLFDRLRDERPGETPSGQLRTLQWRVKNGGDWRRGGSSLRRPPVSTV